MQRGHGRGTLQQESRVCARRPRSSEPLEMKGKSQRGWVGLHLDATFHFFKFLFFFFQSSTTFLRPLS